MVVLREMFGYFLITIGHDLYSRRLYTKKNIVLMMFLLRSLFSLVMLLMTTSRVKSIQVAVLGSGIASSTAACTLAERGIEVTVYEVGFSIGGRTSTRITQDEFRYQFDQGAQYISKPKTVLFEETLKDWKGKGWVKE